MKVIDISRIFNSETPIYPGDIPPKFERINEIENDNFNRTFMSMSVHCGTHIDAPNHFISKGKAIHELDLSVFYGECTVVAFEGIIGNSEMTDILKGCQKRLLLKGQNELSESAAYLIANSHVKLIGVESQSVGNINHPLCVHVILLENGIIPLEGLDLSTVKPGDYTLSAFPLNLWGSDGSPVRAVLIDKEY